MFQRYGGIHAIGLFFSACIIGCGAGKPDAAKTQPQEKTSQPILDIKKPEPPPAPVISGWRGDGSGRYPNATPPIEWSDSKNIKWTAKVGTTGYSMPVVMGDRVFVGCEPNELFCVSLAGKVLWSKKIAASDLPAEEQKKVQERVGQAGNFCPTPVCDGKFVYAMLGNGLVACFDAEGNRQWLKFFDQPMTLEYGRSASLLMAGGKLILQLAYLIAVDPKDGKLLWEAKDAECSYGSPAATKIGDADIVITPNGAVVRVSDGKIIAKGIGTTMHASPIVQDGVVYFIEVGTTAVQLPDKIADEIKPKELWSDSLEGGETFASPLLVDGLIYSMSNHGDLRVLDAKTGKLVYSKETEIPVAGKTEKNANIYPCPTQAGKYLYCSNDRGDTFVLELGKEYKEVKCNVLSSGAGSSPVFTSKGLFLRGDDVLMYIEQ